jgi:hypothetical protein
MEKKGRAVKDKRYEDKHKAERKAKCMVWGTSVIILSESTKGNERSGNFFTPDNAFSYGAMLDLISSLLYYNMQTFVRQAFFQCFL